MNRLMDALPGVALPVEAVAETLLHMWDSGPPAEAGPMGYRASQLNLILHLGLKATQAETVDRFDTAIRFAQRHPCRLVVLCPSARAPGAAEFEGKLFSQCYLGGHLRERCCCEALILGYSPEQADFLESQVSVWLEPDLPVYHWLHRVPARRIASHYLGFLARCRRVLFDGAVDGDRYDGLAWPEPQRAVDLARARILPLRQHLGQFLGAFPPADLVDGLESLHFHHSPCMAREAWQLMRWMRHALARCFPHPSGLAGVDCELAPLPEADAGGRLRVEWRYRKKDRHLRMDYSAARKSGRIDAALGADKHRQPLHIEPLAPEAVLAEALFF